MYCGKAESYGVEARSIHRTHRTLCRLLEVIQLNDMLLS
uniref:Uncharacterized protein n=1 Tax=Oryza meridionalis TaxID=40149 RepID=A0A0E0DFP1_9ORYZ